MPVTPTGVLSAPLDKIADMIAASTTFQTWTSSANAAAAKLRVYIVARSASGTANYDRPFALVTFPDSYSIRTGMGSYGRGAVSILFEADTDSNYLGDDEHQDAAYAFTNVIGAILDEMADQWQAGGVLQTSEIQMTMPPQRSNVTEGEDYFQVMFSLNWGLN